MYITWHTPEEGKHNGTINCSNGHIQFRDVKPEAKADHDDAVREMANAMPRDPGTTQQGTAFLEALGATRVELGDHIAFAALPTDWKSKLKEAEKAVNGAPEPAKEPATLEELQQASPEIVKQIDAPAEDSYGETEPTTTQAETTNPEEGA